MLLQLKLRSWYKLTKKLVEDNRVQNKLRFICDKNDDDDNKSFKAVIKYKNPISELGILGNLGVFHLKEIKLNLTSCYT